MRLLIAVLLFGTLCASGASWAAPNVFNTDAQFCSGRPWIDVTCNLGSGGADPTGVADSTAAINAATASAITNGWPVFFPLGTYKVTSKLTWDYQGQATNGFAVISRGATLDTRTIGSGNALQVQCSGGTTISPIVCHGLRIEGQLTVLGSTNAYVVAVGKTDFSDRHDGTQIEHLVVTNANSGAAAGAIQVNYATDSDLWLSGSTPGGSSATGAVALEQVQSSRIGGYASATGASAPALLVENGATTNNSFVAFSYDPNANTCISITSAGATANAWLAPNLPCTTAINASTSANKNALIGPTFSGSNRGPLSTGISIFGRGSVHRYSAPSVSSQTLYGSDDGTIFSAANATGAGTGFAGSTLTLTLPDPVAVGSGWTTAFVSDGGKAVVVNAPGSSKILARGQQLSSLTVAAPNSKSLDLALLESDGVTGFRLVTISQGAGLLNGLETTFPATWMFLPGPGYSATVSDNGEVISSSQTSTGLAVTLPQITTLPVGWSLGFSKDSDKAITVTVNNTNGGQILRSGVQLGQTSLTTLLDHQVITLYFDGSNFREISPPPSKRVDATSFGAQCGATVDATGALQLADNYFTAAGGGGTITVSCPLLVAGTVFIDDYVHLQGEGAVYYRGTNTRNPDGSTAIPIWPPTSGPAISCTGTISQGFGACIYIRGIGWEVDHINFGNPQPAPPGSGFNWTPTGYPFVIGTSPAANFNGGHLHHLSFTASTNCIDIEGISNYNTQGIAAAQGTISDIWFNGCFNTVLRMAMVDNTWRVSNIDEDFWWNRNNPAVGYYTENNRIGLDLCYAANTEFVNYEWFLDKYAIQFTNCSVTGTITNTAAAYNLQFTNVDFNEVCQAVAVPLGTSTLIATAIFTNVIAYQDNSWCGNSQVYQHPNPTGQAFFDFTCTNCDVKIIGMHVFAVDTLASIGYLGNLTIAATSVNSYSSFRSGQPALKVPNSAHVVVSCLNDLSAWVPANGSAGPLVGTGVDGTQGTLQPCYSSGGSHPGGGAATLTSTSDIASGYVEFFYDPLAPPVPPGGSTPTNRLGYAGFCFPGVGCNFAADQNAAFIRGHAASFSQGPALQVDTDGARLLLNVNGLPTSCAGLPTGTIWDNGGVLQACP